jgi:hypothetical protein
MTIHARFLPKYPKRIQVSDGLTISEANGVVRLGFDYTSSEFGAELQQAVDAADADATTATNAKIAAIAAQTAAATSATEAQSWAGQAETAVVNIDTAFDVVADAQAASIAATKKAVLVFGFATLGIGGARYKRVATQPTHAGKFRSTDRFLPEGTTDATNGGWWEICEPIIDARMLGAVSGSNADDAMAAAIAVAAALGVPLLIPAGTFIFTKEVNLSALIGSKIILGGDVVFDFTGATSAVDFPNFGHVVVIGDALVALPALSADITNGATSITFSGAHGLQQMDRFCAFNPTHGSFNGQRTVYYAGEWYEAVTIDSTTAVTVAGGSYAPYTVAAVDMYKHPNKPIYIGGGRLTIKESVATGFAEVAGFRAERIADSDFSCIRPTNSLYAAILVSQCIGLYGSGYLVRQQDVTGGNAYGIVFANCQDCFVEGTFEGGRHAVALGGSDGDGCVPNRNIYTKGFHRNSPSSGAGIGAWNSHGNSEFCGAEGTFDGGITPGGDHMRFRGRIRARSNQSGLAVFIVENIGLNFDFEGMEIEAAGDPSGAYSVGVIDLCGQSSSGMNAYTTRGGMINFNNVKFNCPDASILISMSNNGFTTSEKVIMSLAGASWRSTNGTSPVVLFTLKRSQSRCLDELHLDGFINRAGAGYSMDSPPLVGGWRARGALQLSTLTSVNNVSDIVTFPFKAPKAPKIIAWLPEGTIAGEPVVGFIGSPTTNGASIGIVTATKANFPSGTTVTLNYDAALDEC